MPAEIPPSPSPEATCIPLPFALFHRSPPPGATDVPLAEPISVSISRPAQIVELTTEPDIVIANVNMEYVSVASGKYTFYPAEPLQPLMTYTAMVTYGQREAAEGRCPTSVVIWQFTTGSTLEKPLPTPTPTLTPVQYSMEQMAGWYYRMQDTVWSVPGVAWTDLAERKYRIEIGMYPRRGARKEMEALVDELGIPREVISIKVGCEGSGRKPSGTLANEQ
ncbi:MAG: Ig-like domain-containing protein, partial [Dehalococcoidia bacterium]